MINIELRIDDLRIAITLPVPSVALAPARSQPDAKGPSAQPEPWLPHTIARSASGAWAAFRRLHGAVADTQQAPADERWGHGCDTAEGDG